MVVLSPHKFDVLGVGSEVLEEYVGGVVLAIADDGPDGASIDIIEIFIVLSQKV